MTGFERTSNYTPGDFAPDAYRSGPEDMETAREPATLAEAWAAFEREGSTATRSGPTWQAAHSPGSTRPRRGPKPRPIGRRGRELAGMARQIGEPTITAAEFDRIQAEAAEHWRVCPGRRQGRGRARRERGPGTARPVSGVSDLPGDLAHATPA